MDKTRELIGKINQSEAESIEPVVERLNGLEELLMIVTDKKLSMKVEDEISNLKEQCEAWWKDISSKYEWNVPLAKEWELDSNDFSVWLLS